MQQFPDLACGHRAEAKLQRIRRAHSRVSGRHQAHGIQAAKEEGGEVSGRPDVVDHYQDPAVGENPRQVKAGLLGVRKRGPFPFQVHAQI